MFPLIGGLISGGASLLGSMFSANTSAQNTQAQIQASEQQQATQNQFQETMSNTAYQRASADMQKAGLNPAMMFGSGSAASSPAGSSIQAPMPQTKSPWGDLGSNVKDALSSAITAKTMDKLTEEISNLQTTRALDTARTDVEKERANTQEALTHKTSYEATGASIDLMKKRVDAARASDILSMPEDVRRGVNVGEFQDKHIGGAVGGAIGAAVSGAKAARKWWDGQSGDSFSDRFNSVYGRDH